MPFRIPSSLYSARLSPDHAVTEIVEKVLTDSQNSSFDCRCWFSLTRKSRGIPDEYSIKWVNGSRVLTHDPLDPPKLVDPFDPGPTDPLSALIRRIGLHLTE